jgi:60 kDa SS-A/Ro ribonucleoprotein
MTFYAKHFTTKKTPQSEKIPGSKQVKNSAGGYSFPVDDWTRFDRFLVLGSEGGSYYAGARKLTIENAECVIRCVKADGLKAVERIVAVSQEGRAPKNDPAIFALALALKKGDLDTRRAAKDAVPKVCRIGTHMFQFADACQALGGWGRLTAKAVAAYYNGKTPDRLALDLFKYQSREGWTHKDLLAKSHLGAKKGTEFASKGHETLFRYIIADGKLARRTVKRTKKDGTVLSEGTYKRLYKRDLPRLVEGVEKAREATSARETATLIREYGLPRECVKTEHLNDLAVWEALLMAGKGMPVTAMIRNLGKMSSIGLIKPLSEASKFVVSRLRDPEVLAYGRVHPMSILMALRTYEQGHGFRGSLSWTADKNIASALDKAFYLAFKAVKPTNQNWLLALDVSGSMGSPMAGTSLTCREGAAAMALVTMNVEPAYHVIGFTGGSGRSRWGAGYGAGVSELPLNDRMSLRDAVTATSRLPFGGTDCALPMIYATKNKLEVDTFVVYTDSETWAGSIHPVQALREYRQKMGRPSKLIVVGMVSNGFSIADPNDAGMLDVVGFDTAAPNVMSAFAAGDLRHD